MKANTIPSKFTLVTEVTPNPSGIPALHVARGRFYAIGQSGSPKALTLGQALRLRAELSQELDLNGSVVSIDEDPGQLAKLLARAAKALTEN